MSSIERKRIQIGRTDVSRFIGIQAPPVENLDVNLEAMDLGKAFLASAGGELIEPYLGAPYTQFEFEVIATNGDERARRIADAFATVLREYGYEVSLNTKIVDIGLGHVLFGGENKELG